MMEMGAWDGTISRNDFCIAARAFADRWQRINSSSPPWSWVSPPPRQQLVAAEGYLSLENIRPDVTPNNGKQDIGNDGVGNSGEDDDAVIHAREEEIDAVTLMVQSDCCEVHYYDFHVVYSDSYRVPVLYFRGYCGDGRSLLLNEIEKDLPACSTQVLIQQSKWTFITQEEHPYLTRPWYKLHPCGTGEWMKLLFHGAKAQVAVEGYLLSWLSVVGQVVGLRVPMEMAIDNPFSVSNGCT